MHTNSSLGSSRYRPLTRTESKLGGILTVIGAFLLMCYLGCFYLWGNISIYIISYFYHVGPQLSYNFIFMVMTVLVLSK